MSKRSRSAGLAARALAFATCTRGGHNSRGLIWALGPLGHLAQHVAVLPHP